MSHGISRPVATVLTRAPELERASRCSDPARRAVVVAAGAVSPSGIAGAAGAGAPGTVAVVSSSSEHPAAASAAAMVMVARPARAVDRALMTAVVPVLKFSVLTIVLTRPAPPGVDAPATGSAG